MNKVTELFKKVWMKWLAIGVAAIAVLSVGLVAGLSKGSDESSSAEEKAHAHKYIEEVTMQATCLTAGVKTYVCGCGDKYEETVLALGHHYENYVCTHCGDEIKTTEGLLFAQFPEGGMAVRGMGECTDTEIVIPATYNGSPVTRILSSVFQKSTTLKSIVLPDTLVSIGDSAFSGCSSLESVNIPNGVTAIGDWTFQNCSSLTSIVIPKGVTRLGMRAFYGCENLTVITFNGTVEEWNVIAKEQDWNKYVPATEVVCSDGSVEL